MKSWDMNCTCAEHLARLDFIVVSLQYEGSKNLQGNQLRMQLYRLILCKNN